MAVIGLNMITALPECGLLIMNVNFERSHSWSRNVKI